MEITIEDHAAPKEYIPEYFLFTDDPYVGVEIIKRGTYAEISDVVIKGVTKDVMHGNIATVSVSTITRILKLHDQTWIAVRDDMMIKLVNARNFRNMMDAYKTFMTGSDSV